MSYWDPTLLQAALREKLSRILLPRNCHLSTLMRIPLLELFIVLAFQVAVLTVYAAAL